MIPGALSVSATVVTGSGTRYAEDNAWSSLRIIPRDGSTMANALPPGRLDASKFSLVSDPVVADTTAGGAVVRAACPRNDVSLMRDEPVG